MDFENMSKEELIEYINNLNEEQSGKYGLVWDAEKVPEQVVVDCNKLIPVLKEEENKKIDNGGEDNILIEGDNFHSLSVLNYTHKESIDVIYIDPPYNTGNKDFMYNDSFVDVEDGYRHSKWLNFMSKRLKLARNLLKEDGVIFISIDDNELFQLKLLCDNIFGCQNFRSLITVIANPGGRDYGGIAKTTEYLLVYSKNTNTVLSKIPDEKHVFVSNDEYGPFELRELRNRNTKFNDGNRPNLCYPFYVNPNDIDEHGLYSIALEKDDNYCIEVMPLKSQGIQTVWRWGKEQKSRQNLNINIKAKLKKDGTYMIVEKYRDELVMMKNYWDDKKFRTENGSLQLKKIFGSKIFDYPKPVEIIKQSLYSIANKSAVILDFFAGSGTTAQAVLELNKEDGGNRKFILCTNNENNICEEVTYQRIKTVITGNRKDNSKYSDGLPGSLKYFKTDFVENNSTRDQIYFDLTEKCVPMLCVKESTFDLLEKTDSYVIYKDKNNINYTCIYFDIHQNYYNEFIEKIKLIENKKALYIFSLDNRVEEYELDGITNYKVEAIPQKIYDLYRKLVKLSKEN